MIAEILLISLIGLPLLSAILLGALHWFATGTGTEGGTALRERFTAYLAAATFGTVTLATLALAALVYSRDGQSLHLSLGAWFRVEDYFFPLTLVADRLSLPFSLFCGTLVGLVGAFSYRYLHRESGFHRFYLLLAWFGAGVQLVVLGGSLDMLFIGWEWVGLTSALLIAYFHERRAPAEHGLRAFITYRLCDVGLLAAVVWSHHALGGSQFQEFPASHWASVSTGHGGSATLAVGLMLVWAAMGKSAQVPLGGWLPRAMEGPTPSSALFYGAISVHLGPYLLLRMTPIIESQPVVMAAIVAIGFATALHGTFVGRVQTDIKSALAYASMTQVGLIFMEIGLGLRYIALLHIVGHAATRSMQILRSPSVLDDYQKLEAALGTALPRTGLHLERWVPAKWQPWLYRHALERGYFDALLRDRVVGPFVRIANQIDALDQRWVEWLSGPATQAPKAVKPPLRNAPRGGRL